MDYGCLTDCDILLGYEEVSSFTCWSGYQCVFNGNFIQVGKISPTYICSLEPCEDPDIAHGEDETRIMYLYDEVDMTQGRKCSDYSQEQKRTCTDGDWSDWVPIDSTESLFTEDECENQCTN